MSQVTCMLVLCWFCVGPCLLLYWLSMAIAVVLHHVEVILQDSLPGLIHVYALGFCLLYYALYVSRPSSIFTHYGQQSLVICLEVVWMESQEYNHTHPLSAILCYLPTHT
jgi:hypothetical protein